MQIYTKATRNEQLYMAQSLPFNIAIFAIKYI